MSTAINCVVDIDNISRADCKAKYGQIIGVFLESDNTGMTFANSLLEATWTAKINAAIGSRLYIPSLNSMPSDAVRNVEEPVFKTGNTGKKIKSRDGKVDYKFTFDLVTLEQAERINSLDSFRGYAYFVAKNGVIIGSKTSTNLIPVEVDVFTSEIMSPENEDGFWSIDVYVNIVPTSGYFTKAIIPTAFNPLDFQGIKDIDVTVISSSAASKTVVFDVVTTQDGTPVSDLATATDFRVALASSDVAVTSNSITNVGNRYTLVLSAATVAAYTIKLINQPSMTVKGYEQQTATNFTFGT